MMILWMPSRIVPMMAGMDTRRLSALWGRILLFNFGNAARVSQQLLTGSIEVIALA